MKAAGGELRSRRCWSFSDCVFDEANWLLTVSGRRVPAETKPLELLRELLTRPGELVTKDELLDRIWRDVVVVEASVATAVHKLRAALNDEGRDPHIIETVQRLGYRLSVPVHLQQPSRPSDAPVASSPALNANGAHPRNSRVALIVSFAVALLILFAISSWPPMKLQSAIAARPSQPVTQREAANALRELDVGAVERMLAAGWNPNAPFDKEGNAAISYVLNKCEWDRGHDQEQMVLMVRTLIDGGARIDQRNAWGDTPYSIAKAIRYCGPNHPVTNSLRTMCFAGYKPFGDRCLASYELSAARPLRTAKQRPR